MRRFLWMAMLCLLLAGCSRVKFAYNQLDWVIPYRLQDYIELSDGQQDYLEVQLDRLLQWHCTTQLTDYAALLRQLNAGFQRGDLDAADLSAALQRVQALWRAIKREASPAVAGLFLSASEAQIEAFFAALEERDEEWFEPYRNQTAAELRRDFAERMTDRLEDWLGALTPLQRTAVQAWSQRIETPGEIALHGKRQWQQRLRSLLAQRGQAAAFSADLERLLVDPDSARPARYRQLREHNVRVSIELMVEIGERLTPRQRTHLDRKVASMAEDFEQLACPETLPAPPSAEASLLPRGGVRR